MIVSALKARSRVAGPGLRRSWGGAGPRATGKLVEMDEPIFIEQLPAAQLDPSTRWVTASLRRRVGAIIIDSLIVSSIATVAMLPFVPDPFESDFGVWGDATASSSTGDLLLTALGYLVQSVVWVIYAAKLTTRTAEHGQTPGKQLLRVRIVRADGDTLDTETAWRRATWFVVATSATSIAGLTCDAAVSTAPLLTDTGDAIAITLVGAMLLTAIGSLLRQTFYDARVRTIVVEAVPAGQPRPVGNTDPLPIDPRPRTWSTWPLAAGALLITLLMLAMTLWPAAFE